MQGACFEMTLILLMIFGCFVVKRLLLLRLPVALMLLPVASALCVVCFTLAGEDSAGHRVADPLGGRLLRDAVGDDGQRGEGAADDPREDRQHQ